MSSISLPRIRAYEARCQPHATMTKAPGAGRRMLSRCRVLGTNIWFSFCGPGSYPAVLKSFIDRVVFSGATFWYRERNGLPEQLIKGRLDRHDDGRPDLVESFCLSRCPGGQPEAGHLRIPPGEDEENPAIHLGVFR